MIHLGLCCIFRDEPIVSLARRPRPFALLPKGPRIRLSLLLPAECGFCFLRALRYCAPRMGSRAFRINSQILPLATHLVFGYRLADSARRTGDRRAVSKGAEPWRRRRICGPASIPTSRRPQLAPAGSRGVVAGRTGVSVGGRGVGRGGCREHPCRGTLWRQSPGPRRLCSIAGAALPRARSRLTVENDDKLFAPLTCGRCAGRRGCRSATTCTTTAVTRMTGQSRRRPSGPGDVDREPLFHISSPLEGGAGPKPRWHPRFHRPGRLSGLLADAGPDRRCRGEGQGSRRSAGDRSQSDEVNRCRSAGTANDGRPPICRQRASPPSRGRLGVSSGSSPAVFSGCGMKQRTRPLWYSPAAIAVAPSMTPRSAILRDFARKGGEALVVRDRRIVGRGEERTWW